MVPKLKNISLIRLLLLITLLVTACGGTETEKDSSESSADTEFPAEVLTAPLVVQQSYQFAVDHPDVLSQIPCYCGCGAMGHTSNYACYVAGQDPDGTIQYDNHALGCSICVDITQDTMRLMQDGKSVQEIRAYVDQTYAQYGPSNIP